MYSLTQDLLDTPDDEWYTLETGHEPCDCGLEGWYPDILVIGGLRRRGWTYRMIDRSTDIFRGARK